jgi:fatty-acyl-CoA synthase
VANPYLDPIITRWKLEPGRPFAHFYVDGRWIEVSLDQLMRRALQFGDLIKATDVGREGVIFVTLRYGLDAHAAFIGAMLAGGIASFLPHPNVKQDEALYWRQHSDILAHIAPKAVIVDDDLRDAYTQVLRDAGVAIIAVSDAAGAKAGWNLPGTEADALALVQHSSGTTGLKKGTALSYDAICGQIDRYAESAALGACANPIIATWLPLYHDMGLITSFLMPLRLGIPIVGIDPFIWVQDPSLLFEAIETFRATHIWLPNFAFHHLVRTTPKGAHYDLRSIQMICSCSEPCKPAAFDHFLDRFAGDGLTAAALQTCYAMAEAVFAVSQSAPGQPVRRLDIASASIAGFGSVQPPKNETEAVELLSNGRPIQDCKVRILRDRNFVAEREIGEICVSAPFLFKGYYKNEQSTRDAHIDNWYRTGDIGFLDDGEVFIVGRIKDVIIVNGKNIFAHDVEAALSEVRGLKAGRSVAFGYYVDALGSEQLVVVGEREGADQDPRKTISEINRVVIDEAGIPCGDIRIVEQGWLLKTTSGKISRSLNSIKYAETFRTKPKAEAGRV